MAIRKSSNTSRISKRTNEENITMVNGNAKEQSDKKFASKIEVQVRINVPMTKMLFDYFNIIQEDKKMATKNDISINGFFVESGYFVNHLPTVVDGVFSFMISFFHKDIIIHFNVSRYIVDGQYVQNASLYSSEETYIDGNVLMKVIFKDAITNSDLKGKYLYIPAGPLAWEKKTLEKRGFNDIFLPKSITEDLEMYHKVYDKKQRIMRYLLAGNPGTGKTESVLAIANVLKNKNVTIIKTVVCEYLKEKMELAEMLAPCLIIFDDIDMYLGSRKGGHGFSPILGQFLDVLDGTEKVKHSVGIIATTNSIDLLDLAAQRPGRFDRILSFDDITRDNIKNIIIKSLNYNFQLKSSDKLVSLFTNKEIIELFYTSKVTGSHIYNTVKMLKLRIDVLDIKAVDYSWAMEEIKKELKMIDKIRSTSYLNDKLDRRDSREVGFRKTEESPIEEKMEVNEVKGWDDVNYSHNKSKEIDIVLTSVKVKCKPRKLRIKKN